MSLYDAIPQMKKMLVNLDKWIEKGAEHAKKKAFDPNVLVTTRLAPDMYPLVRQVQSACDAAKFTAARLSGKVAPKHEDKEQTIDELHARIRTVVAYLGEFAAADFKNAETQKIELPFLEGVVLTGSQYLFEMAQPNFYFHITTAYDILRHNGVELGKLDYIGGLSAMPAK
jgi:uncharacterized protein